MVSEHISCVLPQNFHLHTSMVLSFSKISGRINLDGFGGIYSPEKRVGVALEYPLILVAYEMPTPIGCSLATKPVPEFATPSL